MKPKPIHILLSTATLLAASAMSAHAALIASENFDYNTSTAISGQNGGTGWSGAWSTTGTSLDTASTDDSLWFGQSPARIEDGTGHIELNNADASNLRILSTTIPLGSETLYFSMLFTVAGNTDPAITVSFGRSSDNIYRGTVQLDNGKLGVEATYTGIIQTSGTVYTTDKNYMLVMKRTWGGIFASVFEGDGNLSTTLATEPGTWQVSDATTTGVAMEMMYIEIDGVGGTVTRLDDIRVATDWNNAVGTAASTPGTLIFVQ